MQTAGRDVASPEVQSALSKACRAFVDPQELGEGPITPELHRPVIPLGRKTLFDTTTAARKRDVKSDLVIADHLAGWSS